VTRVAGGLDVACRCLDDRPEHQELPLAGKLRWIAHTRLSGETGEPRTDTR
jgi:hypothetical protein